MPKEKVGRVSADHWDTDTGGSTWYSGDFTGVNWLELSSSDGRWWWWWCVAGWAASTAACSLRMRIQQQTKTRAPTRNRESATARVSRPMERPSMWKPTAARGGQVGAAVGDALDVVFVEEEGQERGGVGVGEVGGAGALEEREGRRGRGVGSPGIGWRKNTLPVWNKNK